MAATKSVQLTIRLVLAASGAWLLSANLLPPLTVGLASWMEAKSALFVAALLAHTLFAVLLLWLFLARRAVHGGLLLLALLLWLVGPL